MLLKSIIVLPTVETVSPVSIANFICPATGVILARYLYAAPLAISPANALAIPFLFSQTASAMIENAFFVLPTSMFLLNSSKIFLKASLPAALAAASVRVLPVASAISLAASVKASFKAFVIPFVVVLKPKTQLIGGTITCSIYVINARS